MKIFSMLCNYYGLEGKEESLPFWSVMPDSTMIRSGKPVFLPDIEHEHYLLCPTLCLRIDRLGKHVARKFAGRYFGAAAPAVVVISFSAAAKLRNGILPRPEETVFDGACIVGDFTDYSGEAEIILSCGEQSAVWQQGKLTTDVGTALQAVSRLNTIKSGDLLLAGPDLDGIEALIDTTATATLDGRPLLQFNVK